MRRLCGDVNGGGRGTAFRESHAPRARGVQQHLAEGSVDLEVCAPVVRRGIRLVFHWRRRFVCHPLEPPQVPSLPWQRNASPNVSRPALPDPKRATLQQRRRWVRSEPSCVKPPREPPRRRKVLPKPARVRGRRERGALLGHSRREAARHERPRPTSFSSSGGSGRAASSSARAREVSPFHARAALDVAAPEEETRRRSEPRLVREL
mmetsp:Transcript_48272/g.95667  ORF Transcript_48272/g.95667 Transcript_48272/m.95667 type:complete len:207 (-) Transcript_48272:334-954(-)